MILPNDNNSNNPQTQFGANFDIAPNDMWRQLLLFQYPGAANAAYQDTDQAFIDAWDAAIDMYGEIFSGLTLVATTGDGLLISPTLSVKKGSVFLVIAAKVPKASLEQTKAIEKWSPLRSLRSSE